MAAASGSPETPLVVIWSNNARLQLQWKWERLAISERMKPCPLTNNDSFTGLTLPLAHNHPERCLIWLFLPFWCITPKHLMGGMFIYLFLYILCSVPYIPLAGVQIFTLTWIYILYMSFVKLVLLSLRQFYTQQWTDILPERRTTEYGTRVWIHTDIGLMCIFISVFEK